VPSRELRRVLAAGLCLGALLGGGALASDTPSRPPSQAEVEAALAALRADPDLNGTEMRRRLKRREPTAEEKKAEKTAPSTQVRAADHGRGIAAGIAEVGRVLIWLLGAAALLFVALGLRRWIRAGAFTRERKHHDLPSHVRDLDIRPDSLPEQVGQAAWALWQRGEQRAALSLLYRAMLSRLVHVHAVPILGASTEGECVELARKRLAPAQLTYVEHIVGAWQMTVYGARHPDTAWIQGLCQRFDAALPAPALVQSPRSAPK
jgi:hypothetical protein